MINFINERNLISLLNIKEDCYLILEEVEITSGPYGSYSEGYICATIVNTKSGKSRSKG